MRSLRGSVKSLRGYKNATVDEETGITTPAGYYGGVTVSDARRFAMSVSAQANALESYVTRERPFSRVLTYVPASDLFATAGADGTTDYSGTRTAGDGFDYSDGYGTWNNPSTRSTQSINSQVDAGEYLSPLSENYTRLSYEYQDGGTTKTMAGSHMNNQVNLWTYRVVEFDSYVRDDAGNLWVSEAEGEYTFKGVLNDDGSVRSPEDLAKQEGYVAPTKPEGAIKEVGSLTDYKPLGLSSSTAAIRPDDNDGATDMTKLQQGIVPNGGSVASSKDEYDYVYQAKVSAGEDVDVTYVGPTQNTRRSLTWNFTGQNGSRGVLNPGQAIIVDFMMQFNPNSSASTDVGNALILSAYADKAGSYTFYDYPLTRMVNKEGSETGEQVVQLVTKGAIYDRESTITKDSSYRSDINDGNGNGDRTETLLRKDGAALSWSNNDNVVQEKMVQPKYTDEKFSHRNQTAAVPEGTSFTYEAMQQYTGISENTAALYQHSVIADTLPREQDKYASTVDIEGSSVSFKLRQSQWMGWLQNLDSIRMEYTDTTPTDDGDIKGKYQLRIADEVDKVTGETLHAQAEVWVGPIRSEGSLEAGTLRLTPLTTDSVVEPIDVALADSESSTWTSTDQYDSFITRWMAQKTTGITYGPDGRTEIEKLPTSQTMASVNMVELNTLKAYLADPRHAAEADSLTRCIGAVWCRVLDDDLVLMARNGDVRLKYDLKAPLNLPKFLGSADKTFKSIDLTEADFDGNGNLLPVYTPLQRYLYETSQWNTFMSMVDYGSSSAGYRYRKYEDKSAGVYVDAPQGYGYIGSYVWLDSNWDTLLNDTVEGSPVTTDLLGNPTTYHKGDNGRYILSTEKSIKNNSYYYSYDNGKDTRALLTDLDYDGVPDDPGINGVKVELLNKWGVPVNRLGEAVTQVRESASSSKMIWVKAEAQTGAPLRDIVGDYQLVTTDENVDLGAYVYTTESDYYNNRGYYMFSMLTPGTYRLRFTFPKQYANYALTTKRIGAENAPVIDNIGEPTGLSEDISAYLMVNRTSEGMVVTSDEIEVEPVAYDPVKYAAGMETTGNEIYDAKMTSYNVGIAMPVVYEGVAYRDDKLAGYEEQEEDPEQNGGDPEGPVNPDSPDSPGGEDTHSLSGGVSAFSLTPENAPDYDESQGELPPFITVNGKQTLNMNRYVEEDGSVDPELIDGVLDWVNVNLDEDNPYEYALSVDEMRLKNMLVSVQVQDEVTKAWTQAYDTNGNLAIKQTDCYLEVFVDGAWQRAFDAAGNNRISAEVINALDRDTCWRWVPYSATAADATGAFSFSLEPGHTYKVICRDTKNRILKPSVMTWDNDPLHRPLLNAEDQPTTSDGRPDDEVAAMWDNDLWLKSGVAETNSFAAVVPTDAAGRAIYEDPKNIWKGYKIYDKLALGWIDGTKGFLGNYIWSDKNEGTEANPGGLYDGLQGDTPNIGVGGVKVTLEQYFWKPNDASAGDGTYNPGSMDNTSVGGRWVLSDLEYKTTVSSSSGSYIFKGVSTYVADPSAPPTVEEEEKGRYLAGYRVRIDLDALKGVTGDWGVTFRNKADGSVVASFDEEIDSDAAMTPTLVMNGTEPYVKNGRPVYAYYLNEANSGAMDANLFGQGTLLLTGGHDADVSYQQMIVVAGNLDSMATENLANYLVGIGKLSEEDATRATLASMLALKTDGNKTLAEDGKTMAAYLVSMKVLTDADVTKLNLSDPGVLANLQDKVLSASGAGDGTVRSVRGLAGSSILSARYRPGGRPAHRALGRGPGGSAPHLHHRARVERRGLRRRVPDPRRERQGGLRRHARRAGGHRAVLLRPGAHRRGRHPLDPQRQLRQRRAHLGRRRLEEGDAQGLQGPRLPGVGARVPRPERAGHHAESGSDRRGHELSHRPVPGRRLRLHRDRRDGHLPLRQPAHGLHRPRRAPLPGQLPGGARAAAPGDGARRGRQRAVLHAVDDDPLPQRLRRAGRFRRARHASGHPGRLQGDRPRGGRRRRHPAARPGRPDRSWRPRWAPAGPTRTRAPRWTCRSPTCTRALTAPPW